ALGPPASAETPNKIVEVFEVGISDGDRRRGTLSGHGTCQLDNLAYRRKRLRLDKNVHPVMTEASPNLEIELSPPPIAELHTVKFVERNPVDVQNDIVRD